MTALSALAAGEDEFVAPDFAARLIAGESPVRVWREARGLSGKALAAATKLSALLADFRVETVIRSVDARVVAA